MIHVCSPKQSVPFGALKLSVASHAPCQNPAGWKDLWKLSPFSIVPGGLAVPGMETLRSKTVENAWQFLKIWGADEGWDKDTAIEAFRSDCAMRFPRGKKHRAVAHYWGETNSMIGYTEARHRIYLPAYLQLLRLPDRQEIVHRLRKLSEQADVYLWDYDSYSIKDHSLRSMAEAINYEEQPFAHAFIVAMEVSGEISELLKCSEQ